MALYRVGKLPGDALAAAAEFHARVLPEVIQALASGADHLTIVLSPADDTHDGWRLAAVQGLAREFAPIRINALASDDETAIDAAARYCAGAAGVTGQILPLDGNGAGAVL